MYKCGDILTQCESRTMSFALLRRTVAAGRVQANSSLVRLVSPVRSTLSHTGSGF